MPPAKAAYRNGAVPAAKNWPIDVRGAQALVRAAAVGGAASSHFNKLEQQITAAEGRHSKKLARLFREAKEALDTRRYKVAGMLLDEGIALFREPPPLLWCWRLVAASKMADYQYVVENYQRIRDLATSEEEHLLVDHSWLDCLIAAGYLEEALREGERLAGLHTDAWASIKTVVGVIQGRLGDREVGLATQKAILEKEPGHVLTRWNLAIQQLEAGELPEAFDNYEARWDWPDFPSERRTFDIPRWNGENPEGKNILVWREQGIGDEIRFAGVLPDLVAAGAQVTFECGAKLVPLFRLSFPSVDIRPALAPDQRRPEQYRGFDYEVPVGSLARHFRPTVERMREKCRPWLRRDPEIEGRIRADMGVAPHQPVIGVCWRSSNRNLYRNQHYINAEYLTPLKLLGASKFVCLQYDECRDEVAAMRQMGLPIYDFGGIDQMNDMLAASYLTGACDLVISAGTATAELSAGLGVPTVLFGLPNAQIQLGTDGVPWHPATRSLPLDPNDPIGVAKSVLFDWRAIAAWAEEAGSSGRPTDWRLSFPGAA